MRSRTRALALALALVAIPLGTAVRNHGWGDPAPPVSAAAPAAPASSAPVGASARPVFPRHLDYVALGDSYSAGPLIEVGRQDPVGCFRSTNNYPAYLAGYFGVRSYRDVTCSGATTDDFRSPQTLILGDTEPPPQLDALSRGTDLVTIGIGGNDFGLFGSLISTCGQVAASDPQGTPCQAHFTDDQGVDTKARDARLIQANVARVTEAVRRRAPHAEIYLIGYPQILPDDGATCAQAPLAAGDYVWADRIGALLNRSVRLAARDAGVHFLGLAAASQGHDVCAGPAAWVNGKDLRVGVAADYHPFRRGMRAEARELYRRITGSGAPTYAFARPPAGSVVPNPVG
jgi:lysophospholipase L1-like esterase